MQSRLDRLWSSPSRRRPDGRPRRAMCIAGARDDRSEVDGRVFSPHWLTSERRKRTTWAREDDNRPDDEQRSKLVRNYDCSSFSGWSVLFTSTICQWFRKEEFFVFPGISLKGIHFSLCYTIRRSELARSLSCSWEPFFRNHHLWMMCSDPQKTFASCHLLYFGKNYCFAGIGETIHLWKSKLHITCLCFGELLVLKCI